MASLKERAQVSQERPPTAVGRLARDPKLRAELVEACLDPLCTYASIAEVLMEDHEVQLSHRQVSHWWHAQPEYKGVK